MEKSPPPTSSPRVRGGEPIFHTAESSAILDDPSLPNIGFFGLTRAGKSSIVEVVFRKASPHEAHFFSATPHPVVSKVTSSRLVNFAAVEIPGAMAGSRALQLALCPKLQALVFVVDVRASEAEGYVQEIGLMRDLFLLTSQLNPSCVISVFIHKLDGDCFSNEDYLLQCRRKLSEGLRGWFLQHAANVYVNFHSTSIYDHTVHEGCSALVQPLLPHAAAVRQLLDVLAGRSRMEKVWLFDVLTKLAVASNSSLAEGSSFEVSSELIDLVIEISGIYESAACGRKMRNVESQERLNICVVQLNSGFVLYLQEIEPYVVLVCAVREQHFGQQFLLEFNVRAFTDLLHKLAFPEALKTQPLETQDDPSIFPF